MLTEFNPALHTYEGARNVILENTARFLGKEIYKLEEEERDVIEALKNATDKVDKSAMNQRLHTIQEQINSKRSQLDGQPICPNGCCMYAGLGNLVTLRFLTDEEIKNPKEKTYFFETTSTGAKSLGIDSPVGKAILGKEIGTIVPYYPKKGTKKEVEILKIQPYSEAKIFLKQK